MSSSKRVSIVRRVSASVRTMVSSVWRKAPPTTALAQTSNNEEEEEEKEEDGGSSLIMAAWQADLGKAMDVFLEGIKLEEKVMKSGLVLISFVKGESEVLGERLEQCLKAAGMEAKREVLVDAETLEKQLSDAKFVIVLCSPEYAKIVQGAPQVRDVLDKFGHTQKNALQTLLCFGEFSDTAFQVVAPHYLVRDFRNVLSADPKQGALFSEQTFIDILFNLSGSQGLGLLPDILGLDDKANVDAAAIYQKSWQEFKATQQSLTVDYHSKLELETSTKLNPLLSIQDSNKAQLTDTIMENVFPATNFDDPVWRATISPDDRLMAVQVGNKIHIFDVETRKSMKVMEGHTRGITCLSFSPNGQWVLSGSEDKTLRLWGLLDQENPTMKVIEGHARGVTCSSFSPNGQWIVSGSWDRTLRLWGSLDQEKPTMKVMDGHADTITCLAFSPNGQWIASGSWDKTLRLWGSLDQKRLTTKLVGEHTETITCLSFSPNGQWIVSGGWDKVLRLWGSLDQEKPTMKELEGHTAQITCLSFSPDGLWIASGCYDKTLRLWSSWGQEIPVTKVLEGHTGSISCLSFSPNGQWLASGSEDTTLRLWGSLDQDKPTVKVMDGHTQVIKCLLFRSNGQWIASGSEDNTLRFWNQ